jgi:hypothetical protein
MHKFRMESVAQMECALWCFHKALEKQEDPEFLREAVNRFESSEFVLRRRAFHTLRPLLLKPRLDVATAVSEIDPSLAVLVAGCEYEMLLKRSAARRGYRPKEKDWNANAALHLHKLPDGVRIDLDEVWILRNKAVHGSAKLTPTDAERMIDHIRRHCATWNA